MKFTNKKEVRWSLLYTNLVLQLGCGRETVARSGKLRAFGCYPWSFGCCLLRQIYNAWRLAHGLVSGLSGFPALASLLSV